MSDSQTDFYNYCNKEWLKNNEIPQGYSRWSRFNELADKTLYQLKSLLPKINDNRILKLINMFENYNIENEKKFVKKLINEIMNIQTKKELLNLYQTKLNLYGVNFLFNYGVESDLKNSDYNILYIEPTGLTLPNRDYYLDEEFKSIRNDYLSFISNISEFYEIKLNNENILNFEKYLASYHMPPEEKRDPNNIYFPKSKKEINNYFIPIDEYFSLINKKPIMETDKIIITNEKYFENFLNYSNNLEILKEYLIFKTIISFSRCSNGKLYELIFDFFGRKLSGKKEPLDQWKRKINLINQYLGELLSKFYVDEYFSLEAKVYVSEMIGYFKNVLKKMISNNSWMESITKEKALEKLEKINFKIGYPDKWETFENLDIKELSSLSECIAKINEWWFYYQGKELYNKVDDTKWEMMPHEVNAYYHPLLNEIVFPSAILQEPFFSLDYTIPQNYGGIGVVIAHELTHGFDDQGRKFDSNGNLENWWSKKDEDKFNFETKKIVEQFNNFELYGMKLNGKLTLGENLADLGGVRIALEALKMKIKNLTKDNKREFFESFAKIWANLCAEEEGKKLIKIDPHSPGVFRVNGILPHLEEFHEIYQIKYNHKMFLPKEKRCNIWCV